MLPGTTSCPLPPLGSPSQAELPAACPAVPLPLQVSNLLLAAGMTQRWYRRQFKSYPPARRAIIPFLY